MSLRKEITKGYEISSILNGMWQVSGAHGYIDKERAIKSMEMHVKKGFVTFDLADHYGPAEDFVREFREKQIQDGNENLLKNVNFFTKWVPPPIKITKNIVEEAVNISKNRMGMETLDMIQFHWWEYQNKNYLKALEYLNELKDIGLIKLLGITNFDTNHLQEFLEMGFPITSNQVQYSLIDRRPEKLMEEVCRKNDVKLLAYGTLAGGLLSKRYLNVTEPRSSDLNTASLQKYKRMIDRWGDWNLFQKLLNTLNFIAEKHDVSIANVAVRYVLDNPVVAGAIIGVRLGISDHIEENLNVFNFELDDQDLTQITSILDESRDLMKIIGDCGDEYR